MSAIHTHFLCRVAQGSAMATLVAAGSSVWAQVQTCSYDITTVAGPVPTSVPSLSMLGVALLAAAIGFMAWRMGKFPGARFMAIVLVAAAAMLANQGGGGLIQKAYAAAVSLTNPAGESLSASGLTDGEQVTFTNNSGVPLRISSITPTSSSCDVGTVIPVGGSCAITLSCPEPLICAGNQVAVNGVCESLIACPQGTIPGIEVIDTSGVLTEQQICIPEI